MSRRKFLGTAATAAGALCIGNTLGCSTPPNESSDKKFRAHPLEGIERENIKITDIKISLLSYELEKDEQWPDGDNNGIIWKTTTVITEVFTDKGIVGIGGSSRYRGPERMKKYLDEVIKPIIIGKNPFDVEYLTGGICGRCGQGVWAGVDTALWDIIGKAKNMPVYKMLATDNEPDPHIRCYASYGVNWKFYDHPETLIEDGIRYKEEGYTAYKIRKGTNWAYSNMTIKKYVPFLYKLREAVGYDMEIMQETMMGSGHTTEEVAEQLCPVLDELKIHWFEQPVGHWRYDPEDIPEYRKIKDALSYTMVSGGESHLNRFQVMEFIEQGVMDVIQTDCNTTGISENWFIARLAHSHGKICCPHNWHGGLTTMGNAHFAAGIPNRHMLEINQSVNDMKEGVFKEPLVVVNGYMDLPDKPGLGVVIHGLIL